MALGRSCADLRFPVGEAPPFRTGIVLSLVASYPRSAMWGVKAPMYSLAARVTSAKMNVSCPPRKGVCAIMYIITAKKSGMRLIVAYRF